MEELRKAEEERAKEAEKKRKADLEREAAEREASQNAASSTHGTAPATREGAGEKGTRNVPNPQVLYPHSDDVAALHVENPEGITFQELLVEGRRAQITHKERDLVNAFISKRYIRLETKRKVPTPRCLCGIILS